jgi:hypothetical protein
MFGGGGAGVKRGVGGSRDHASQASGMDRARGVVAVQVQGSVAATAAVGCTSRRGRGRASGASPTGPA